MCCLSLLYLRTLCRCFKGHIPCRSHTSTELTEPLYFSHALKFTLYSFSFRFIAELWSKMFSALPFARQLFTSLSDALTGRNEVSEFAFSFWVLRHTFVFSAVSQIQFLTLAILARGQVQICQIWNNLIMQSKNKAKTPETLAQGFYWLPFTCLFYCIKLLSIYFHTSLKIPFAQ